VTSDQHHPQLHAATHPDGGADEITSALDVRAYPLKYGLASARPAFGIAGQSYYSTDTKVLESDNGTAWVEIARGETATRLAQLIEKSHASLTNITATDHHTAAILEALLTTAGDIIKRGATIAERLAIGANGQVLEVVTGAPAWANPADKTKIAVLTPSGAILPATAGAEQAKTDGTNFSYYTLNFDQTAEEKAYWEFALPPDFDAAQNILIDIWWFGALITGAAVFGVSVLGRTTGEAYDAALGTEQLVTTTIAGVTLQLNKSTPAAFASGWAAGDVVIIKLARKAADVADTLAEDAKMVMVVVSYEVVK